MAGAKRSQGAQLLPPVTLPPELLPLNDDNFHWERFEAFCRDLVSRLPGVKTCYRYGVQGNRQHGVDLIADMEDGSTWGLSCKQYKRFAKGQAASAVKATTYAADHYTLLLSCEATADVRDEVEQHPTWDVWDVGDVSRRVRELPMEAGAQLVESHFGAAWGRAFLGQKRSSPFVPSDEFFRPLLDQRRLFHHAWPLVGRSDVLSRLDEFVRSDGVIGVVSGRGGIGKTKLLHALALEIS